ncbi:MAG: serine protease [Microthrixaceae bacterium]|nr:trypsin-like peptidase domain-containing protein [Microthrixaceae bacterium]MCO5318366.1 serine protease [Microthrixaceae bacterium]
MGLVSVLGVFLWFVTVGTGGIRGSQDLDRSAPSGAGGAVPVAEVLGISVERGGTPARRSPVALRNSVESSVMLVEAVACGVRRQGTVTLLATGEGPVGLTNAHVVRGAREVTLSGAGLGVVVAPVDEYLGHGDAALLDVSGTPGAEGAGLPSGPRPSVGDEVTLAGFPGGAWSTSTGEVLGWSRLALGGSPVDVFTVDVPVERGASGGVVVDTSGAAIGLVTERDPRTGAAVVQPIDLLLAQRPVAPPGC